MFYKIDIKIGSITDNCIRANKMILLGQNKSRQFQP